MTTNLSVLAPLFSYTVADMLLRHWRASASSPGQNLTLQVSNHRLVELPYRSKACRLFATATFLILLTIHH
jgi:hypothetical protein